jgi:zinc protease
LLRQIALNEASVDEIAQEWLSDQDLGLPIDESQIQASHYLTLTPGDIQSAFRKWMRPSDLVSISQGPAP